MVYGWLNALFSAKPPPAEKANAIIEALPGNSIVSKTGIVVLGTGAVATAISQELYVATDETVLLIGTVAVFSFIVRAMRAPYKEWAETNINVGPNFPLNAWILRAKFVCPALLLQRSASKTFSNPRGQSTLRLYRTASTQ